MIKYILTALGLAIHKDMYGGSWLYMVHGHRYAMSVCHDLGPNISLSSLPTQPMSTLQYAPSFEGLSARSS